MMVTAGNVRRRNSDTETDLWPHMDPGMGVGVDAADLHDLPRTVKNKRASSVGRLRVARHRVQTSLRRWCSFFCAPRRQIRNTLLLVLLAVTTVGAMELLGRLRYRGYFNTHEPGNGQLGFYHEMDVDTSRLQDASGLATSRMFPTSALPATTFASWITARHQRTNGRKFLVGCSSDWEGYVLRSFLELFGALKRDHGWQDLVTDDPLDFFYRQDPQRAPSVLFFCLNYRDPFYLLLEHNRYFQELRALGTLIVVWSDDLQYFDRFNPIVVREQVLKRADVLMGSYSYLTDDYFYPVTKDMHPQDLPILSWLPHSSGREFIKRPFNEYPIDKIILSGKLGETYYPLRHWLGGFQRAHTDMMDLYSHAGYHVENNQTEIYASYLRSYRVAVTTTLIHQFLVAKLFEIPATGALLLVNRDLAPLLDALGMQEDVHFVGYDREQPEPKLWWAVDPDNRAQVDRIRLRGMQLVREQHLVQHRVRALERFLTAGEVAYAYPETLRIASPCPMIAFSSTAACEASFQWQARHKCDFWFCATMSFFT